MKNLIIEPTGGLCNRLRVIFSYIILSEKESKILEVIWKENESCNGKFLDFFEEIPGVIFKGGNGGEIPFYKGCYPLSTIDYKNLKLKNNIIDKVENRMDLLKRNYISAHIRRTDHVVLSKSRGLFMTDELFIDFFNKSDDMIFLSTDNPETQTKFKKIYKDRLILFNDIKKVNNLRMTTLEESILDIYTCIGSSDFLATKYSSFSDFITQMRKNI